MDETTEDERILEEQLNVADDDDSEELFACGD